MKIINQTFWMKIITLLLVSFTHLASAFYDPKVGRWLNRDPLGTAGGANLYCFAGNDGINRIDPFGLQVFTFSDGQTLEFEDPEALISIPCDTPLQDVIGLVLRGYPLRGCGRENWLKTFLYEDGSLGLSIDYSVLFDDTPMTRLDAFQADYNARVNALVRMEATPAWTWPVSFAGASVLVPASYAADFITCVETELGLGKGAFTAALPMSPRPPPITIPTIARTERSLSAALEKLSAPVRMERGATPIATGIAITKWTLKEL
jgi:hypothetical protein